VVELKELLKNKNKIIKVSDRHAMQYYAIQPAPSSALVRGRQHWGERKEL
jgi:hypothetical protein